MPSPTLPTRSYDAFLFDMDGTLITSVAAAERAWAAWAGRHGLDLEVFMPTIHGVRAVDTIRNQNLPGIDLELPMRHGIEMAKKAWAASCAPLLGSQVLVGFYLPAMCS